MSKESKQKSEAPANSILPLDHHHLFTSRIHAHRRTHIHKRIQQFLSPFFKAFKLDLSTGPLTHAPPKRHLDRPSLRRSPVFSFAPKRTCYALSLSPQGQGHHSLISTLTALVRTIQLPASSLQRRCFAAQPRHLPPPPNVACIHAGSLGALTSSGPVLRVHEPKGTQDHQQEVA